MSSEIKGLKDKRKSREARHKENLDKIRRMLREGPKSWQQFLKALDISPATLAEYLKELMQRGELKAYNDPQDRRITWYEAINEKMENELKRSESLVFIENIEEPLVIYEMGKDGKTNLSIFLSNVGKAGAIERKLLEMSYKGYAKNLLNHFEKLKVRVPREGYKIAIVLTKEK